MLRSFGLPVFYKDKAKQRRNAFALRDVLTQYLWKAGDQNLLRFDCFYPFKGRREAVKKKQSIYSDCFVCSANQTIQRLMYLLRFYPAFLVGRAKWAKPLQLVRCAIYPLLVAPWWGEMSRSDRGVDLWRTQLWWFCKQLRKSLFAIICQML